MYEGLRNLLELKGMGMAEDASGFQKAFRLVDLIPMIAAEAMPKQNIMSKRRPMAPAPMPPQMSTPVYRQDGGVIAGGKVDGDDFVIDAYTVAALGNGSSDAGAKVLDQMLPNVPNTDGSFAGKVEADNGDGMSDEVAFKVANGGDITDALISQDEYIVDGNVVKELGEGNTDKGVALLEDVREDVRQAAYGTTEQPNQISAVEALRKLIKETA